MRTGVEGTGQRRGRNVSAHWMRLERRVRSNRAQDDVTAHASSKSGRVRSYDGG